MPDLPKAAGLSLVDHSQSSPGQSDSPPYPSAAFLNPETSSGRNSTPEIRNLKKGKGPLESIVYVNS